MPFDLGTGFGEGCLGGARTTRGYYVTTIRGLKGIPSISRTLDPQDAIVQPSRGVGLPR